MNLAITVFIAICIASVIGTLLQQNLPYNDYIIKFGPFWHEVYLNIGLYDVYGVWWFFALLGFLLMSTSVCIYRNGPTMLRDMRQFRMHASRNSLRAFHQHVNWQVQGKQQEIVASISDQLAAEGYRLKQKQADDHIIVAAMRGGANRFGYLMTHIAIVVICIGALVDGNVPLKLAMMTGEVVIEKRNIAVSKVPAQSILGIDNPAFRGAVNISEGESANVVFLTIRDGYLVQELPFSVELKDFRIEHYASGQPKSFESDLVIHDDDLATPLEQTIAVNHPLTYKGYSIYQASFSDGGTKMKFKAWPFNDYQLTTLDLNGKVFGKIPFKAEDQTYQIEITDFRLFNINPVAKESGKQKFKNFGPSFTYKLRDASGQAREFMNYMSPVEQQFEDGNRFYYMSGVRESVADSFRYLFIPVDSNGSIERFMKFRALIQNPERVKKTAGQTVGDLLIGYGKADDKIRQDMTISAVRLVGLFIKNGADGINNYIKKTLPTAQQQKASQAYGDILQKVMGNLYLELLEEEGINISEGVNQADAQFFNDAYSAMGDLQAYGSNLYLQLEDFEHIQASGLQITRSPGKDMFYLGCVMLIAGIFMMFYIQHYRIWAWIGCNDKGVEIIFAGSSNRHERDFAMDFERLRDRMANRLGINPR